MEIDFNGHWSDRERKIWEETDWKNRNYKELPIEDDTFEADAYFYGMNTKETKRITFVKYIRSNPVFAPYYGPVYKAELLEFMKNGSYCYPCCDGRTAGQYNIHDRFDIDELADLLSR